MPTPKKHADVNARMKAYRARLKAAPKPEPEARPRPIPSKPGPARWRALQAQAQAALEAIRDEMQEHFDERSEPWQESDRGQEAQERIDILETVLEALDSMPEL